MERRLNIDGPTFLVGRFVHRIFVKHDAEPNVDLAERNLEGAVIVDPGNVEAVEVGLDVFVVFVRRSQSASRHPFLGGICAHPRSRRVGQPPVQVILQDVPETRRLGILRIKNGVSGLLKALTESTNFGPLLEGFLCLNRVGRKLQFLDPSEEPFDLRKSGSFMALHRPVEFLLRARLCYACGRSESLPHNSDHECERATEFFQRLLSDELLGAPDADRRVILPINYLEPYVPKLCCLAVVALKEISNDLPFSIHVAGGRQKDVI